MSFATLTCYRAKRRSRPQVRRLNSRTVFPLAPFARLFRGVLGCRLFGLTLRLALDASAYSIRFADLSVSLASACGSRFFARSPARRTPGPFARLGRLRPRDPTRALERTPGLVLPIAPFLAVRHAARSEALFWVVALWSASWPPAYAFWSTCFPLRSPVGLCTGLAGHRHLSPSVPSGVTDLSVGLKEPSRPLAFPLRYFRVHLVSQAIPAVPPVPASSSPLLAWRGFPCGSSPPHLPGLALY